MDSTPEVLSMEANPVEEKSTNVESAMEEVPQQENNAHSMPELLDTVAKTIESPVVVDMPILTSELPEQTNSSPKPDDGEQPKEEIVSISIPENEEPPVTEVNSEEIPQPDIVGIKIDEVTQVEESVKEIEPESQENIITGITEEQIEPEITTKEDETVALEVEQQEVANEEISQSIDHEMIHVFEEQELDHSSVGTEEVVLNEYSEKMDTSSEDANLDAKGPTNEEIEMDRIHSDENGKTSEIIEFDDSSQEQTLLVVSSGDNNTKEIVIRTTGGHELSEGTVTVQEVTDESGQIYLVETMDNLIVMESEDNADGVEYVDVPKVKNLPSHVLGRNIVNPAIDPFRNGKAPPKPRLGVKIPYRNLTSQIVSKQEITNEILERSRRNLKESPQGQNLFAKKLTQNLAKKLAPGKKGETPAKAASTSQIMTTPKEKKLNNSDLLAILEGDDDDDAEQKSKSAEPVPMTKELERKIALKQLSELPDDPLPEQPKAAAADKADKADKVDKAVKADKADKPDKTDKADKVEPKKVVRPKSIDSNVSSNQDENIEKAPEVEDVIIRKRRNKNAPENEEQEDDLPKNPRFSSNVPLKTYTRKRKPSEEAITPQEKTSVLSQVNTGDSTKKIDLPMNSNSYITKSSRIIKKKIIWDPDEATPRKLVKSSEGLVPKEKPNATPIKTGSKETGEKKLVEKRELVVRAERLVKGEKKEEVKIEKKQEKSEETKSDKKPQSQEKVEVKKVVEKSDVSIKKVDSAKKLQSPKQDTPRPERKVIIKSKDGKTKEIEIKSDKLAALKFKKRLTEVDKLLMDEGAVNMLYSFKNTEEDQTKKKYNKSLMSKTNELLNDLQTSSDKDSPKALRKKEATIQLSPLKSPKKIVAGPTPSIVSRNKSRDSNRSSVHSPPASPGPVFPADASRIIRRHSSSSFSSADEDFEKGKVKKSESRASRRKIVEAPQEVIKKKLKKDSTPSESPKETKGDEPSNKVKKQVVEPEPSSKYEKYKTFVVLKYNQLIKIVLIPNKENSVYINIEIMQEVIALLKELETDSECNIAMISSDAAAFCHGINFKMLIAQKEITRKNLSKKLATCIRDFLLALANFPKILIAGVHGATVGLGVTMLPLFDLVVATKTATFSTPYASLGCIAEGGSLLSLPHLSSNVLVSELLYASGELSAERALQMGLVTKIIETENFNETLAFLKDMCNQSAQFMEATKKQFRQRMIPDITTALNSETETLVQQWISAECQKNFSAKYNA